MERSAVREACHTTEKSVVVGCQDEEHPARFQPRLNTTQVVDRVLKVFDEIVHGDDIETFGGEDALGKQRRMHGAPEFTVDRLSERSACFDFTHRG